VLTLKIVTPLQPVKMTFKHTSVNARILSAGQLAAIRAKVKMGASSTLAPKMIAIVLRLVRPSTRFTPVHVLLNEVGAPTTMVGVIRGANTMSAQ